MLAIPSYHGCYCLRDHAPILFPSPCLMLLCRRFRETSSIFQRLPACSFPISTHFAPIFLFSIFFISSTIFIHFPFRDSKSSPEFLCGPTQAILPETKLPTFLSRLSQRFCQPRATYFSTCVRTSHSIPKCTPIPTTAGSLFCDSDPSINCSTTPTTCGGRPSPLPIPPW